MVYVSAGSRSTQSEARARPPLNVIGRRLFQMRQSYHVDRLYPTLIGPKETPTDRYKRVMKRRRRHPYQVRYFSFVPADTTHEALMGKSHSRPRQLDKRTVTPAINPVPSCRSQPSREVSIPSWISKGRSQRIPFISNKRRATIQTCASLRIDNDDLWTHARIDWFNVLINIGSFLLLMTDVPRAGITTHTHMRPIADGVYAWFGSFAYEVITFWRFDAVRDGNVTATTYAEPVEQARTWSYTFDTTSYELRTITSLFNASWTSNHVVQCMNYQIHCSAHGVFAIPDTFAMLDHVVGFIADMPESAIPVIYPRNLSHGQHLKGSFFMKSRHVFIVYDKLVQWLFHPIQLRSIRFSHWPSADSSLDICADPRDRPFLCDATPTTDYRYSADPSDAESANVTFVWNSINDHVHAIYKACQANSSAEITVDVTVLEGYSEPMTYTGGWVSTVSAEFEIVVLTRVRECWSKPATSAVSCRTIRLTDYRYEGSTIVTDVANWNRTVSLLRVIAQGYYLIRLVMLFIGCYTAFPKANRSMERAVFLLFSEIPGHVVCYGSLIPIAMYTLASVIDGPIVSAIIHSGGLGMQGSFLKDPERVLNLVCLLMRRQWLLASLTMLWLRLQVLDDGFCRHNGVVSVRGHIIGILSSMSMVVGYYHPRLRDTRVIEFNNIGPHVSVVNARLQTRGFVTKRIGGCYSDMLSIALSAVVYSIMVVVLRVSFRPLQRHWMSPEEARGLVKAKANTKMSSRLARRIISNQSFFFCRTDLLPSTCGTLWMIEGLTCAWANDVFLGLSRKRPVDSMDMLRRSILMNIVQMTEPLNLLRLRWRFNAHKVYTYMQAETQTTFMVVGELTHDPVFSNHVTSKRVQVVRIQSANELPFHELVRCR